MLDFSDMKESYQHKKGNKTVTRLIPQFVILSSFIHLQSRDISKQGGKNTVELRQKKSFLNDFPLVFYVAMIPFELYNLL